MSQRLPLIALVLLLAAWLAASYGVRYGLMEDARLVGLCASGDGPWQCPVRSTLGLLIHFRVLAWASLAVALAAWCVPGRTGRLGAVLALLLGVPALVLYSASLAVFAVVIAGLRLVRSNGAASATAPVPTRR